MSYSFDYDPESGQTPWPLVWTVVPTSFNWEGDIGNPITFSTKAKPDPAYPDAWDEHHSAGQEGGGFGTGPVIPDLPPQPVVNEYLYQDASSSMDVEYIDIATETGVRINNVNSALFFPYKDIRYYKNGEEKSVQFPEQAIDDNFDYVVALVPDAREFIVKNVVIHVDSTSTQTLTGNFKFRVNNDWSKAKTTLEAMSVQSKQYFDSLADGVGEQQEQQENNGNAEDSAELEPSLPDVSASGEDTVSETEGKSYDEIFRNPNQEEINTLTEQEPDLIEDIKADTVTNTSTDGDDDQDLATEANPVDDLLRNNDIDTLISDYGYSYDEIIEMMRNI